MTVEAIQPPVDALLSLPPGDPLAEAVAPRLRKVLERLMGADSRPRLYRDIETAVFEYLPIKYLLAVQRYSQSLDRLESGEATAQEHDPRVWSRLPPEASPHLSASDRQIIVEALKTHLNVIHVGGRATGRNQKALWEALVEGFWSLQKLDLAVTAVLWAVNGDVPVHRPESVHWLCLAARKHLRDFQSVALAHDPVLRQRMEGEARTMTTEELERCLGL